MAQLDGYKTGGTIHIVVNNQVGFTTNYLDARSSTYCTDVGKVTLSPVFHVNGDDVEAVVHAMEIAVEYRQKFNKDVFIVSKSYSTAPNYFFPKIPYFHEDMELTGYKLGDFPNTEEQSKKILTLPIHQDLKKKDILRICKEINSFYN